MKKFFKKVFYSFTKLNISAKFLLLLATFCLFQTILSIFFNLEPSGPSDVTIRSTMSSIFGFFFGQQCKKQFNIINYNNQVYFAGFTALISLLAIIFMTWLSVNQNTPAATDIRNLLLTTVGFLISMVKEKDD